MVQMKPTRDGFGEALLELGEKNKNIVALCADLSDSTRVGWFRDRYPDRFFSFGVSEQDMYSAAAGLALTGKIPFASTFGVFASGRAWDQIRISIAYMDLNVKIIGTHGGISVGPDGALYPCVQFVGHPEFAIGSAEQGIDENRRNALYADNECLSPTCAECALGDRCHCRCGCLNFQVTGDYRSVPPILCEYERMLIPIADKVAERLFARRSPLFIQRHYNELYPLLSYLEDIAGG